MLAMKSHEQATPFRCIANAELYSYFAMGDAILEHFDQQDMRIGRRKIEVDDYADFAMHLVHRLGIGKQ